MLEFDRDALASIAKMAIERETGARGLRAIVESFMTSIMYEIPSDNTIEKCIITRETVEGKRPPTIIYNEHREPLLKKSKRRKQKRVSAS
jgi:ATP-dependent Clp protease ATP-binding subunit ClpX